MPTLCLPQAGAPIGGRLVPCTMEYKVVWENVTVGEMVEDCAPKTQKNCDKKNCSSKYKQTCYRKFRKSCKNVKRKKCLPPTAEEKDNMRIKRTVCKNTTRVCEWRKVMVECKEKPEEFCENQYDCIEDSVIECKNVMQKKEMKISKKIPTTNCRWYYNKRWAKQKLTKDSKKKLC